MAKFKAAMRMVWGFIRTFWWVIILVIAAILVGWVYLVDRKKRKQLEEAAGDNAPSLVAEATRHVQEAVTDVKVERAIISTESKMKREALEEIRKEPDGKKRRERLASVLQDSL